MSAPSATAPSLSGKRLASNTIWNLVGMVGPMLVALWAIPILVARMGTERFGLMSIVWMMVGYFSLFDLGIGRALTKAVAERLGTEKAFEIPTYVRSGMRLMWALGILGGCVIAALSPWLAGDAIKMVDGLREEALWSLLILAAALPFVIASAGNIGILQAAEKFAEITYVRLPLGIANYLGPVVIMHFSTSLIGVTAFVAMTRVVTWVAFKIMSDREISRISQDARVLANPLRELLSFGGWVTVSNIVGPVMVYFDRFLIGVIAGAAAVAYYTTPFEVVSKLSVLPAAMMAVLFPAFAAHLGQASGQASRIFRNAAGLLVVTMALPTCLVVLFAPEALHLWLGPEFAEKSAGVARWLALGVCINSLAGLPFIALQGSGRPDVTAKLHLLELFFFVPLLWWAVSAYGIVGAAACWTARVTVDFIALSGLCTRLTPGLAKSAMQNLLWVLGMAGLLGLMAIPLPLAAKLAIAAVTVAMLSVGLFIMMRAMGIRLPARWSAA